MSPIRTTTLSRPRRYVTTALIAAIILTVAGYIAFQARFIIEGPLVTLYPEPAIIQHERQITLSGVAENITAISVNGRPILTSEAGAFSEPVVLENGLSIVRIEARDRFGRTTALERSFVYTPEHAVTRADYR
jgi:hypothetical protein